MSKNPKIVVGTADGKNIGFDIEELLVSRLLIQANSGGGKSFLLRRMLEQAYGKVQCIVIDPAGEFASLREKFGYVLVGEKGETPADVRSAALVAEKLLELRASAVCDLYSVKPADRHVWVKRFFTAIMNAPKRLWHPVLFFIDEAHKVIPEKGEGESEAKEEMLSLCSDGRKYGFCAILATQRLAKLDKSAASEMLNVAVGPTFMDIDLQRAHKALGIIPKDQAAFNEQMKTIPPGHFWMLGRAISKTRMLVKVGGVETTHPKAGYQHSAEPPPAPEKIKALLPKLADLPREAEHKARTEAEFKREIRELQGKVTAAENAAKRAEVLAQKVSPAAPAKFDSEKLKAQIERQVAIALKSRDIAWLRSVRYYQRDMEKSASETARELVAKIHTTSFIAPEPANVTIAEIRGPLPAATPAPRAFGPPPPRPQVVREPRPLPANGSGGELGKLALQIAGILAGYYPEPMKRTVLAAMCGVQYGGHFSNNLSALRGSGLLEDVSQGVVRATEKCAQEYAGTFQAPTTTEEVVSLWEPKLSALARQIIRKLVEANGEPVNRNELAAAVGVQYGGHFSNMLSELRSAALLVDAAKGHVAANRETLFLSDHAA